MKLVGSQPVTEIDLTVEYDDLGVDHGIVDTLMAGYLHENQREPISSIEVVGT